MGVLSALATLPKFFRRERRGQEPFSTADRIRACRVERLEDRRLMAFDVAPVQIGMVYLEQGSGADEIGDRFELTFKGGAPGTQLQQLTINTDKLKDGLTIGDVFFDTEAGGRGAFGSAPFKLVSANGIDSYDVSVSDGGTLLTINFTGFDAGEKFIFTIDVDEQGFIGGNAVAEGNEFEGSILEGTFIAPTFATAKGSAMFLDAFDPLFQGRGLDLPGDDYVPPGTTPDPIYTAGTAFSLKQTPLPITIGGTVFEDVNLNNNRDAGDNGIAGVGLSLEEFDGANYVATGKTTTTDANGAYKFTDVLPGRYRVVETQPSGLFSVGAKAGTVNGGTRGAVVSPDVIAEIDLVGGNDGLNYDFAEAKPASLSGHVYHDANNNGQRDNGETGIGGVQISVQYLPESGPLPGATTVTTNADGSWSVAGLRPGAYKITEVQPNGWIDGKDKAGSGGGGVATNPGDLMTGIALVSGAAGVNYDFGELLPSSVAGRVHADLDGDCMYDPDEPLLAGVTIKLLDQAGNVLATTQTNAQGEYVFTGLAPGVYGVEEVQPSGYYQGGSNVGTAGGTAIGYDKITQIVLSSGTNATEYNFCEMVAAKISGRVHADLDGDCMYDENEPLLSGVTIWLLDASGARIRSTQTDANGEYEFADLEPGTYGVEEIQPAGYYEAGSEVGSAGGTLVGTNKIIDVTLGSGADGAGYNFCEMLPASLRGRVHVDLDGDCMYDPEEPLLAGVTIWLLDASGSRLRSTQTDANGEYTFANLEPGTYGVEEIQPAGYYEAGSEVGSAGGQLQGSNKTVGAVLGSGVNATDYNFCELLPAGISGIVHADRDGDCEYDADEPLLAGVTVWLLDASGSRLRSTVTDQNGRYEFVDLEPGTYGVEEVTPNGYFDAGNMVGSAGGQTDGPNFIKNIVLASGVSATDYNFCEEEPASLCGVVYKDLNENGIRDAGEAGIAGVTLRLLDANGVYTGINVVTAADGSYCFMNLRPGTYGVEEIQPTGYYDGADSVGDSGGTAVNPGDKITGVILPPGREAKDYNFGELPPAKISGYVFQDGPAVIAQPGKALDVTQVRDGLRTPDDTPLAGVVLRLGTANGLAVLDANGQPITTVTDANGYYEFNGLKPGSYTVLQDQPQGYIDGIDTPGSLGGFAVNPGGITPVSLAIDPRFDAIVQINVGAGQEAIENNFSEVLAASPPPPPPSTPTFGLVVAPSISTPSPGVPAYGLGGPTFQPLLPYLPRPLTQGTYYGAAGYLDTYSWHLSIIDAGTPRGPGSPNDAVVRLSSSRFDLASWTGAPMDHGQWELGPSDGEQRRAIFGLEGGIPVTGDFNGDGVTDIGVFADGEWFIDLNGNNVWDESDLWIKLGAPGDFPVTGDWDGDGKTDIGVFGPEWTGDSLAIAAEPGLPDPFNRLTGPVKNQPPKPQLATHGERTLKKTALGNLRSDVIDHVFRYGVAGYEPVTGDWNGDGTDTIGVFFGGTWRLDTNGDGRWTEADEKFEYGAPGDVPIVGDFDGDGMDEIGVYRRGVWYIDRDHNHKLEPHDQVYEMGDYNDLPVVGDWDGDGIEEPGLYKDGAANLQKME